MVPIPPRLHASPRPAQLTSIIVPCCNQCEFTRLCLQALFRYTRPTWELIVVDNGSTEDTAAYLAGVQDASGVPVTVITNAGIVGFPAAINQGLLNRQRGIPGVAQQRRGCHRGLA